MAVISRNTVKFVQNEKYSTKSGDFLRFLLYLCYAIGPEPLGFAASRVEELFVAQVLIKKVKLKCCGIKIRNNHVSPLKVQYQL